MRIWLSGPVVICLVSTVVALPVFAAPKVGGAAVVHIPAKGISRLSESQCTEGGGKVLTSPMISVASTGGKMCSTFKDGAFVHECINDVLPAPK
jgi:hypothetical protein